jgi:hypothetical protein
MDQIRAGTFGDRQEMNLRLFPGIARRDDCADARLVAGEPEKVTPVMHEFVHIHALDDRGCAFLGPNEIDREQKN